MTKETDSKIIEQEKESFTNEPVEDEPLPTRAENARNRAQRPQQVPQNMNADIVSAFYGITSAIINSDMNRQDKENYLNQIIANVNN